MDDILCTSARKGFAVNALFLLNVRSLTLTPFSLLRSSLLLSFVSFPSDFLDKLGSCADCVIILLLIPLSLHGACDFAGEPDMISCADAETGGSRFIRRTEAFWKFT
jgi:hypothetical protein